jgi:hypothetical protein
MNNTLDPILALVKTIHDEHHLTPEEACLLIDLLSKRESGKHIDLGCITSPHNRPRYVRAKTLSRKEIGDEEADRLLRCGAEELYMKKGYFGFEGSDPALKQKYEEAFFDEVFEGEGFAISVGTISFYTHHKNESGHKMPELICYTIIFP